MSGYKNFIPPNFLLALDDYKTLKGLKEDKNIVLIKPDKGNGVVILNRSDYTSKMDAVLNDETKFKLLTSDPVKATLNQENKLRNFLKELKRENAITDELYEKLCPTGSRPGILYGLPKVQKVNLPLRPILSALGTHSYNLAKYLVSYLREISVGQYTITDTFSYVEELRNLDLDTSKVFMASFDISSLFTNIPIDETIDIIINRLFSSSTQFSGFSHAQFRKLLYFAVKNCHFLFNGRLYEQVDGVAMGSPLGPSFANTFLCYHEKVWLDNCPRDFKPLIYRRYVDDCFVIFRCPDHVKPFLDYLNSQHNSIKFSSETEVNNTLPFLDVLIERNNGFSTSIYRKPTFSGLFTNFDSFIPLSFKRGLVYTLLDRYLRYAHPTTSFIRKSSSSKISS